MIWKGWTSYTIYYLKNEICSITDSAYSVCLTLTRQPEVHSSTSRMGKMTYSYIFPHYKCLVCLVVLRIYVAALWYCDTHSSRQYSSKLGVLCRSLFFHLLISSLWFSYTWYWKIQQTRLWYFNREFVSLTWDVYYVGLFLIFNTEFRRAELEGCEHKPCTSVALLAY